MTRTVAFEIPGRPVGKGRHRSRIAQAKDGRRFIANYTPKETASYEGRVKMAAAEAIGAGEMFLGAVAMHLNVLMPIPASWPKRKQEQARRLEIRPTNKPDCDNVLKAVADACTGVIYRDDAQIVEAHVIRYYADRPGVRVMVTAVSPDADLGVAIVCEDRVGRVSYGENMEIVGGKPMYPLRVLDFKVRET